MILVTGVTGTVGRELARLLSARPLRVLTRNPERADVRGAEVAVADYADRWALDRALAGVKTVFLVTCDPLEPDDARFVDAARAAGVRHLVKLSAAAVTDPGADDLITRWQRGNEAGIRASGLAWTFLRPRAFMSNTLSWSSTVRNEGAVRALDGRSLNACVDPRDVALTAARVLTEPGRHEGKAYALSGPEAVSAFQQTQQLTEVLGHPLRFEELDPERARAHLLVRHSAPVAEALLHSAERQRAGAKAAVENGFWEVTGSRPRSFRDWALDHAHAFT